MNTNPAWQKTGSATAERNAPLEITVVQKADYQRFDELLGDLHYLGSAKPAGDFLRQTVVRNGEWVGLLAWGPACYALKDRDEWIGWHATQRAERLNLIVQNRRFLLLHERGTEPNLASQALAAALRALPEQREKQFGYPGHWGGVENRNQWRKDAVWLEDATRSRNANLVGNLALLRNALLKIYDGHREHYGCLPAFTESLRADPAAAFRLIIQPLPR